MLLQSVDLDISEELLPESAQNLIDSAWDQIQTFSSLTRGNPVKGFHPSDFVTAYRCLASIRSRFDQDKQPRICEWGSGFGVVSVLASLLDFQATAIESNQELFEAGLQWQASTGYSIRNFRGSFIPKRPLEILKQELESGLLGSLPIHSESPGGQSMWLDLEAESVFELNNIRPDEFEVIYAYPWPGEEEFLFRLFEVVMPPDSLLLSFHGAADFRLHKRINEYSK